MPCGTVGFRGTQFEDHCSTANIFHVIGTFRRLLNPTKCQCSYLNSINCSFNAAGEKICTCKPSYIQSPSGWCISRCDGGSGSKCENGGTCNNGTCHCPKGTTGDYCQNVDWCEDFRCGNHYETMCVYDPETTMGKCKCRDYNSVYDDKVKNCFDCDCGPFGNCTFVNGSKICKCPEGYSLYDSKCEKCDCGKDESTLCILRYTYKECRCKKNYSERTGYFPKYGRDTRCAYCNCGDHGKCFFDFGDKRCICEENYLELFGKCEECVCGKHGTCKFRENDGKKVCSCDYGYAEQNGKCVRK
ncbi:hypothetical protein TNCV_3028741 [Trichonephila clavipes]|nr:hypothetical protein TNCV_3028741 [Trichonephila clavipes]